MVFVEADADTFVRAPIGRFVRSKHVIIYAASGLMGAIYRGHLDASDSELLIATQNAGAQLASFVSVLDAREFSGFELRLFKRWFTSGMRYVREMRGRLRANAMVVPRALDMRAVMLGIAHLARPP